MWIHGLIWRLLICRLLIWQLPVGLLDDDSTAVDDVDVDWLAVDSVAVDVAVDLSDADLFELHREQQRVVQSQSDFVVMVLCYFI